MADNLRLPSATATTGPQVAADDIGSVWYQRVKIQTGTDGAAGGDMGADNPLFVQGTAGSATIGNVGLSTGGAVFLKTATGGNLPADTTSGLAVKFVNAQSVDATLQAGTATVGSVNLSTGAGVFLKTSTGGNVPVDTTSGLAVKFVNNPTVLVGAGTATVGTFNLASDTAAHINTAPSVATDTWGPKTTNVTASGTTALVSAPGTNTSLYVTGILVTNTATAVHRGAISDGTNRFKHNLAANGGGFCWPSLNPPWKLPGNTALNWVTTDTVNIDVTVHFYNGAT